MARSVGSTVRVRESLAATWALPAQPPVRGSPIYKDKLQAGDGIGSQSVRGRAPSRCTPRSAARVWPGPRPSRQLIATSRRTQVACLDMAATHKPENNYTKSRADVSHAASPSLTAGSEALEG